MRGWIIRLAKIPVFVLTGQLSWDEVKDLIRHSYELVTKT
jgi:predicted DNA-binding protein (MmcQ/YjbR family)